MANQEHLDILRQGVEVWNDWRRGNRRVDSDLSGADLSDVYLHDVNFRGVNLRGTVFRGAKLFRALLSNADLYRGNLSCADLSFADLSNAYLEEANLSKAEVGYTIFGNLDLRSVKGLESVSHIGPSTIGIDTIYLSGGKIPESFLRDAGIPETFITYARSLVNNPIEYYTCFISYSNKDQEFAERLYVDLQSKNVRCWYAPENLKIGDKFRVRIDESIRIYDKLLLILSEHSVRSLWVETEVETAFSKEHKTGKLTLFPVKLDNTVEETEEAWAVDIQRTRHIGDFTRWKEHDEYQKGLSRLLRDLKQDALPDTHAK